MNVLIWAVLLAASPQQRDELANFIGGIERTPLLINGRPHERVQRDAGEVVSLSLDGMRLAADDFRLIGSLPSLRRLSLLRSNVTDKDLAQLRGLTKLEGIVLTNTEVSDKAIDELARLPALRSCCLGNVRITPAGIEKLKTHFPKLSLGYSERK